MVDAPGAAQAEVESKIGKWLAANAGARPLTSDELARYSANGAQSGWRLVVAISDHTIGLDITIDGRFPRSRPRVALVEAPPFPSYPHVEEDGRLCIIEDSDELDHTQPIAIIKAVLGGAAEILEQGIAGTNQSDFRSEFLSYWNPMAKGPLIRCLVDPCGDTRRVKIWRSQAGYIVAEDRASLSAWLNNRTGKGLARDAECPSALLLWFDQPLLPSEYPDTPADLCALAARLGDAASTALDTFLGHEQQDWVILLGSPANNGPCFGAVTIKRHAGHGRNRPRGTKGFRKGKAPPTVIAAEARRGTLTRHRVDRADPWLVHGRDANPDLTTLRTVRVVMLGSGSLGSPIARLLAQAGVGEINLIDPGLMEFANTSRHALGGDQVGQFKASALALRLQREFAHSRFTGHPCGWQKIVAEQPEIFQQADLVISTIGSWSHEGEFNAWQIETGQPVTTLYAWAEPHAAAGHAVLIGPTGGCLACGLSPTGEVLFKAARFSVPTLQREAACGSYFQPYGASEIIMIASMTAELALDHLLGRAPSASYRIMSAREATVADAGGAWTDDWCAATHDRPSATMVERIWQHDLSCSVCGKSGR